MPSETPASLHTSGLAALQQDVQSLTTAFGKAAAAEATATELLLTATLAVVEVDGLATSEILATVWQRLFVQKSTTP